MSRSFQRYGLDWPAGTTDLEVEMFMIRQGGAYSVAGKSYGNGKVFHYEQMRKIIWPELDDHRWHRLCRDTVLRPKSGTSKVTVLMGPKSAAKTHTPSWIYLCEYWCFPEETCVLVSSTDMRSLRMRVWGEITSLWQRGVDRFDELPGHLLDSKLAITTDNLEDGDFGERKARDMRKGFIAIPCVQGGKFVGLSKFQGIKQKRMRLIGDELAVMEVSYLSAFTNLDGNEDFEACLMFNPNDPLDPGGIAAEPKEGWEGHMDPPKTCTWETKFYNGVCVNLVGTDSPNFDFPADQPTRYRYLISKEKIANTVNSFGKDSFEYYSQCKGTMQVGTLDRRVLTRSLCRKFHAQEPVVWEGTPLTKIGGLDAAYGGDRCVGGHIEFGKAVDGRIVFLVHPPQIVPIRVNVADSPEDQIADWTKNYCELNDIDPSNWFHDATGRGSLGTSYARIWSAETNPIDFGGRATDRPVSIDTYIFDPKTHQRRLKLCSEHYDRFVSELWYSIRYVVEADQMRGLPDNVMDELCMREWSRKGDIIVLETKDDMKERIRRSPDLGDWLAICVEGARRRGFMVGKLGPGTADESYDGGDYFDTEDQEWQQSIEDRLLQHT